MPVTFEEMEELEQIDDRTHRKLLKESQKIIKNTQARGRIYFVEADCIAIKIGFALDVERRIKRIEMDCPVRVYLISVFRGSRQNESQIHKMFGEYRIRGEWFKLSENIIEYAKQHSINLRKSHKLKKFLKS